MKPFEELTNNYLPPQSTTTLKLAKTPERSKPTYTANSNILRSLSLTERIIRHKLTNNESQMREHLFKWAIAKCRLILELRVSTIEHCMALFDTYVEKKGCFVKNLEDGQLTILACLFISSKYQEIYPPSVSDFEFVLKYKFNANEILEK